MNKKHIWQIIKQYHWESAFFKNCFRWFLIVLVPTFVLGALTSFYAARITRKNIEQSQSFHRQKIAEDSKALFDTIDEFHYSLIANHNVPRYCLGLADNNNDLSTTVINISTLLKTFVYSNSCVDSVYFYNRSNNYVITNTGSAYLGDFYDTDWYPLTERKTTHISSRSINGNEYITIYMPVFMDGYSIAAAVYNINAEKYMQMFASNDMLPVIALYDRENNLIFSSDSGGRSTDRYSEFRVQLSHTAELSLRLIPSGDVSVQTLTFWIFWIAFVVLFVLDIVLSYHLSLNYFVLVVENIMQFQSLYYDRMQDDELLTELDSLIHNPIKVNKAKNVEHFLINQYRQLNSSRLTSMQEQINPHFIFNTLNLITLIDMDEDNTTKGVISKITKNLAEILRYSIETTSNIVPFGEEIMYLNKYMEIQNLKYDGKFTYEEHIDPSAYNCSIIKFILQPIVENAITHGILTSPARTGTITLEAKISGGVLYITVANTGTKIEPNELERLNELLKTYTDSNGKHIGMINVNNRIKLLYGKKYGISIASDNKSTRVLLTMPYTPEQTDKDK